MFKRKMQTGERILTRLEELIKVVGGVSKLAKIMGVTGNYVTNITAKGGRWRHDVLPIKYNAKVVAWARENYKDVDRLLVCCKHCGKPLEGE